MFRQYDNVKITDTSVKLILVDTLQEITIDFGNHDPIDWMSEEHQTWYGTRGEACFLGGRWFIVTLRSGQEFRLYMHPEIRHTINKSLRKSGEFDLNYRKHIRSKYSRKNMDVFFVDNVDTELKDDDKFQAAVTLIKNQAEMFSYGIESKPTVIITPSWDGEAHMIAFIIIKDGVVVGQGAM